MPSTTQTLPAGPRVRTELDYRAARALAEIVGILPASDVEDLEALELLERAGVIRRVGLFHDQPTGWAPVEGVAR